MVMIPERDIEFIGSKTATDLIYVTHYKEDLPSCMTHALILDKGKVAAVDILQKPFPAE